MPKRFRFILSNRSIPVLLLSGFLVVVSTLAVSARNWWANVALARSKTSASASRATSSAPQRQRPIAQMESELITITPHGFEPREITRPKGRFLLMVDNRSGVAATSLQLTREAGARTHEMRVPREAPNWSDVVDLQPGRYLLTETDHPRWACRITITAQ